MILTLLTARRFLPLFVTQFLGALNDNLFKNAMVMLLLMRAEPGGPALVAAAAGVFILPYALFSSLAGELADRSVTGRLIRAVKLFEVGLMAIGAVGFLTGDFRLLMGVLFGMGVHSTFFGPVKYAILPVQLAGEELITANGLIEAGTFLAILLGTILGSALVLLDGGLWIAAGAAIAVAVAGTVAAWAIPLTAPAAPGLALDWNLWRATFHILSLTRANRPVWRAVIAISWFWTVGATVLSQFPVLAKDVLGAGGPVVTVLLATFSVGIGVGSMLEARLLHGHLSLRHVPWAGAGITLFMADFVLASLGAHFPDPASLFAAVGGLRILADLFLLAVCGGVFSVPLYTLLQERSDPAIRSRVIAANNVMNAVFMVAGAAVATLLAGQGVGAPAILALTAALNLGALALVVRFMRRD